MNLADILLLIFLVLVWGSISLFILLAVLECIVNNAEEIWRFLMDEFWFQWRNMMVVCITVVLVSLGVTRCSISWHSQPAVIKPLPNLKDLSWQQICASTEYSRENLCKAMMEYELKKVELAKEKK